MIRTKIKRSLAAMGRGWIGCNILLLGYILAQGRSTTAPALLIITFMCWLYAGVVIFLAWLLVFLPVDLALPEGSGLRRPGVAALCGALGGCLPYAMAIAINFIGNPQSFHLADGWPRSENLAGWLFLLAAPITGLTAALTLVRRYPRMPAISTLPSCIL